MCVLFVVRNGIGRGDLTNEGRNIAYLTLQSVVSQFIYCLGNLLLNWRCFVVLVQGILRGFNQATNIILDESHERVYSTKVSNH